MVRQHVNPLTNRYQKNIVIPDWSKLFASLDKPMHIDIGSAKGNYLIDLAKKNKNKNYLGLEIRETLVNLSNSRTTELDNIHFLFCNANVDFINIYRSLPNIISISILNPDPWFKDKHKKRRLINEDFCYELFQNLNKDVKIYIQSDIKELFQYMFQIMSRYFKLIESQFLSEQSDREKAVLSRGGNIFKMILVKK